MNVVIYQWLVGHKIGDTYYFSTTYHRYHSEEETRQYEVVTDSCIVKQIYESAIEISEEDYKKRLMTYPANPEYGRQIHHSGGMAGHSFGR